jgi:hypothetical protein
MRCVGLIVLLFSPAALAQNDRDGFFTQAPAVPKGGTARLSGAAYGTSTTLGASAAMLAVMSPNLAFSAAMSFESGLFVPAMGLRWQLLSQERAFVDLTGSVHFRLLGSESSGSEIEARTSVGRTVLGLIVAANLFIGMGLGGNDDVNLSGSLSLQQSLTQWLRVGAEAFTTGQLVNRLHTSADRGQPVGLACGGVVVFLFGKFGLQSMVGVNAPRGMVRVGPVAHLLATVDI